MPCSELHEPGANEPNLLASQSWIKRFNKYLDEKPGGKEANSKLLFGCNPLLLAGMSAHITSDSQCSLRPQREGLRKLSETLRASIPEILTAAESITELSRKASEGGADVTQFGGLPTQLRAYAESINEFAKIAAKHSSVRLPKSHDFALFFLHTYIAKATGQPQWRGLADLLEAAYAGHGFCVEVDEENLRKKIERLAARHVRVCSHLDKMAQEYLSAGNGNWFTKEELGQMARDMALRMLETEYPEAKQGQ